ncbi:GNAT family N-acetyltransferase [archaeon]|nr:GNAT family N-acetyltransferase [archaeon]
MSVDVHLTMIKIMPVSREDLPELKALILEEFPYTKPKIEGIMKRQGRAGVFLLKAVEGGRLAGFIDFQVEGFQAMIVGLSVRNVLRRQGIAKKLVIEALKACIEKGVIEVKLVVRQDNKPAVRLYESFGFESSGVLPKKIAGQAVQEMALRLAV